MDNYGQEWTNMGIYGQIWTNMGKYGQILSNMRNYGRMLKQVEELNLPANCTTAKMLAALVNLIL